MACWPKPTFCRTPVSCYDRNDENRTAQSETPPARENPLPTSRLCAKMPMIESSTPLIGTAHHVGTLCMTHHTQHQRSRLLNAAPYH